MTNSKVLNMSSFKEQYFSFDKVVDTESSPKTVIQKEEDFSPASTKSLSEDFQSKNFITKETEYTKDIEQFEMSPLSRSYKTKDITINRFRESNLKVVREILNRCTLKKLENENTLKNLDLQTKINYERKVMCNILEDHVNERTKKLNDFVENLVKPYLEGT